MSTRGLGFSNTLSFDGTNFDVWVIRMLNLFRVMDPNLERIVDVGFSPPKDPERLSLEDERNSFSRKDPFLATKILPSDLR